MSRNFAKMNGVLIIDKPADITSHDVVEHVREIMKIGLPTIAPAKGGATVGHAGTLDPFATGVLLILVGKATRLMEYVNMLPKTYAAELTLGATSDTNDITGEIFATGGAARGSPDARPQRSEDARWGCRAATGPVAKTQIRKTLAGFIGQQQQTPPPYSAVKVKGQKAYQAARKGTPLKLKSRTINIYNIQLIDYQYPTLSLEVTCSSGTYIRALARDIGHQLKTGAYLSKLCRTSIGLNPTKPNTDMKQNSQKFDLKNAVQLDQLTASNLTYHLLLPPTLVAHLPSVILSQSNVAQLRNGQSIEWGSILPEQKPIALFTKDNRLVGIGHLDPTTRLLSPKKIL